MAKVKTAVILHPDAVPLLVPAFGNYIKTFKDVRYFNCDEVDASGPLLALTLRGLVPNPRGGKALDTLIQIPFSFVLGTMEFPATDSFGFMSSPGGALSPKK